MSTFSDETLLAYVWEQSTEAEATAIEAALEGDDGLANRLQELRELLEFAVHADVPESSTDTTQTSVGRDRLLTSLDSVNRFAPYIPTIADVLGVSHGEADRLTAEIDKPDFWMPGLIPGTDMRALPLRKEGFGATWLRMPAGSHFPHHTHLGSEVVVVLQGNYIEGDGSKHHPGAVLKQPSDSSHGFSIAKGGPPFICLSVVENGLTIGDQALTIDMLKSYGG